ncbi:hypothetical protein ABZ752_04000 [Streptomyces roseifaciens]
MDWLKTRLPLSGRCSGVLLTPRSGWVLLERAAAAVRAACPLLAEVHRGRTIAADGTTTDAVRELLRTAPLLTDHTLLLARADRLTGAVRLHSHVLFPAGARLARGETATTDITVYGGVGAPAPLLLPVLAGRPAADGSGATPLAVHQVTVGAGERARLTFALHGPGEVELVAPENGSPDTPATPGMPDAPSPPDTAGIPRTPEEHIAIDIPTLRLPRRIVRPARLELLFTVELSGGDEAETEERLEFVRDLVSALARHDGSEALLRTGAVGHYDHVIRESAYASPRVLLQSPVPVGPPSATLAALGGWRPARRAQDTASSLEDALKAVAGLATTTGGYAEHVRRVVLIVARRPPGLPEQRGIVPGCPLGVDWQAELGRLRSTGVRVMTRADPVTGPPPSDQPGAAAHHYAEAAWAALAADGAFRPGADAAAAVAKELTPVWRVEGPDCRLAFAAPLL